MVMDGVVFLFRFLPLFILIYFLAPISLRNLVLFVGSLIFFAWEDPMYVGIMLVSVLMDFIYGRLISLSRSEAFSKICLWLSVLTNTIPMVVFSFVFPIDKGIMGFGMYMMLSLSYVIACYKKEVISQKNPLHFGTYTTFFPIVYAGVIPDYKDMAAQLKERKVGILEVQKGVSKFITGLAKKVLLAGTMSKMIAEIKELPSGYLTVSHSWIFAIATFFLIFFTASGYADMAIGLARILGFSIPENFDYPVLASSVTQFWDKFLITVVGWFRRNVYQTICKEKSGIILKTIGTMVMWTFMGIWFGRGLNGLMAGLWFGVWISLESLFILKVFKFVPGVVRIFVTHVIMVIGFVIMTTPSISTAVYYLKHMFFYGNANVFDTSVIYLLGKYSIWIVFTLVAALPSFHHLMERMKMATTGSGMGFYRVVNKLLPAALFVLSIIYLV